MGRHSIDYQPEPGDSAVTPGQDLTGADLSTVDVTTGAPGASIAPPGGPVDPGTPGAPDVPGAPQYPGEPAPGPSTPDTPPPSAPQPEPGSPEITPSEPPPFLPDEATPGPVPVGGTWHAAGEVL